MVPARVDGRAFLEQELPPARLGVELRGEGVAGAGERVKDDDGVVPGLVQSAPGLVRDFEARDGVAGPKAEGLVVLPQMSGKV